MFWACEEKKGERDLKENSRRVLLFWALLQMLTTIIKYGVMIEGLMNNSFQELFLKPQ